MLEQSHRNDAIKIQDLEDKLADKENQLLSAKSYMKLPTEKRKLVGSRATNSNTNIRQSTFSRY